MKYLVVSVMLHLNILPSVLSLTGAPCIDHCPVQLLDVRFCNSSCRERLRPELQKLFGFLVVDNKFHYSVEGEEGDMAGTIRCPTQLLRGGEGGLVNDYLFKQFAFLPGAAHVSQLLSREPTSATSAGFSRNP